MNDILSQSPPRMVQVFRSDDLDKTWEPQQTQLQAPSVSIVVLAWAVRLCASFNLIASVMRHEPKLIYWLGHWVPFEISEGRRILMLLTSVLLFILAWAWKRGKRTAWVLTIAGLALAPVLHLGHAVIWPQALVNVALIGFLVFHYRHFVALSDQLVGSVRPDHLPAFTRRPADIRNRAPARSP